MTAKEYFNNNVVYAVEVEYSDGSREWSYAKGENDLHDLITSIEACGSTALSDVDFASQEDKFCDRVIQLAILNWTKNRDWWKRNRLKSLYEVVDFILDNGLYKAS